MLELAQKKGSRPGDGGGLSDDIRKYARGLTARMPSRICRARFQRRRWLDCTWAERYLNNPPRKEGTTPRQPTARVTRWAFPFRRYQTAGRANRAVRPSQSRDEHPPVRPHSANRRRNAEGPPFRATPHCLADRRLNG